MIFGGTIPTTDLMPFARFKNADNVWKADATITVNNVSQTFDGALQGSVKHLGIGLAWSPFPLFGITSEYQLNSDTLTVPTVKTSGGVSILEAKTQPRALTSS